MTKFTLQSFIKCLIEDNFLGLSCPLVVVFLCLHSWCRPIGVQIHSNTVSMVEVSVVEYEVEQIFQEIRKDCEN